MKFNELTIEAHKNPKRTGRGIAAGRGKTAGRGTKGQNSRTGSSRKPGFEGGQTPLMIRLPKLRGFRTLKKKAEVVYTGQLDQFAGKTVDTIALAEAGIITSPHVLVKLVLNGEVTKKVTVKLPGASAASIEAIQKAGGSFEKTTRLARVKVEKAEK